MSNFFTRLIPFIMFGVAIVAFAFGLILLTYLFVFGALVGLGIFLVTWIRERFFSSKNIVKSSRPEKPGRIIDHDK